MTLLAGAAQAYDTREASSSRDRERLDAAQNVKDSTALVNSAENDLDRAKRGTRIDELMDRSREVAARATGIDPSRLPYLAELIDVDGEDNERYRVAMNVAWKSIADTVLVSGDELSFRRDLESIDPASIGRRLKYRFVGGDDILSALPSTRRDGWLSSKIKVDPSSPLGGWVMAYLSDPKNDFYVVEDGEFKPDNNIQQVSVKGQVKIGRKGEYGRGQRPVDFIGFADEAYIAAKEASLVSARDSLEKARNKEREVIERQRRAQAEFDLYNTLRSFEWKDVAVVAAEFAVNRAEEAVNSLKTKNLDKLKANVDSLENEKDCLNKKLGVAEKAIEDDEADMSPVRTTLSRIEQDMGEFVDLLAPGKELLRAFEDAWDVVMTGHETLSEQGKYLVSNDNYLMKLPTKFKTEIGRQLKSKREARLEAENKLLSAIGLFRESCGEDEIEGLSENIAAVDEYLALRANYGDDESIDLPAWIREFIEKLHKLIDLTSEYEKRCKSSFDTINNILLRHAFNDLGEHFRISARFTGYSDRWAAFRDEVRKISESYYNKDMSQWSDDAVATAFDEVASCVDKLAPENGKMAEVLSDPRIRFVFKGEVFGEDGKVPEVITSAAGMNGGKREKTIAFVLAAAIYSALGVKEDKSLPYTLIPIDEAFVKSDSETTSVSLDTLRNFGFQLLVVAPEEKFQTIEAICDRFYITGRANEESAAWIGLPTDNVTEEVYGDSEA